MKLARNREAGQVLIIVLLLLALGPLLVVPMLRFSYSSQRYNQVTDIITLNTYAADSGVEYAKYQILNNPGTIIVSSLQENLVIDGVSVNVTAGYNYSAAVYEITSTATKAERSLTVDCQIVIDVGLFGHVVAVDGNLIVDRCPIISSDNESDADLYTNGDVEIKGDSYVDGDVSASGSITVLDTSTVTGDIYPGVEEIEFPAIKAQDLKDKAKEGGTYNGDYTLDGGIHQLGPLYINGKLDIKNDVELELTGVVYVNGDISIVDTKITGFGDIVCDGTNFDIYNYSMDPDDLLILPVLMSVNSDISIKNDDYGGEGATTSAIVYAPKGLIDMDNVDLEGCAAGETVNLVLSTIIYPAQLRGRADLPGAGLDILTYQFK